MLLAVVTEIVCIIVAYGGAPSQATHNADKLIIGGQASQQGEIPYQVLFRLKGRLFCGGSLVVINNQQVILTAAHCLAHAEPGNITVIAGNINFNVTSGTEQRRRVIRVIVHEEFHRAKLEVGGTPVHDIAILFIDSPFELNENVAPIALPVQGQNTTGLAVTSGWGTTKVFSEAYPETLQWVEVPVVDFDTCSKAYAKEGVTILESMLCAGALGKDSCNGDSGGPLRAVNGGYLAGIVSFGNGCGWKDYAGIYTRVSYYIDWLNAHVRAEEMVSE